MSLLDEILASKRREIDALRKTPPAPTTRIPLDVPAALARPSGAPLRLIAEVKRKSPSAGELSRALAAPDRALAYARAGAAMVSILCDFPFFGGGFEDVVAARSALDRAGLSVPLLAKEFVLDEVQLDAARAAGADAVLLIARIVSAPDLARLVDAARARALEPFVEVVTEAELLAARATNARVFGVNARDLDTLAMDPARASRVLSAIERERIAVHLSGIGTPDAVRAVAHGRADAALVGEALMREADPGPLLAAMVGAATM